MTKDEMQNLKTGDIVKGVSGHSYVVTANYGDRVTAVLTVDITNPGEWVIVKKRDQSAEQAFDACLDAVLGQTRILGGTQQDRFIYNSAVSDITKALYALKDAGSNR